MEKIVDSAKGPSDITQPKNLLENIIYYFIIITLSSGLLMESLCLILFVYHFIKKTPAFCSQYFYLLAVGYVVAIIAISFSLLETMFKQIVIFTIGNMISEWYFNFFLGPWNTILAVNRSTALLFWHKHSIIWSGWRFVAIMAVVLIYPAVGTLFMLISGANCFSTLEKPVCDVLFDQFDNYKLASNGINVGISTILGIVTVLLLRYKIIHLSRDTTSMENHLLIQSIVSSVFFGFYCIYGFSVEIFWDDTEQRKLMNEILDSVLFALSNFYLLYYHMSSTLLLFCLSDTVRKSFIEFYSINPIKKIKQISSTRVTYMATTAPLT